MRWYGDSLDGTRPFVEKKPESTVGIAVVDQNGDYIVGTIVHPFRQQVAIGIRGIGAFVCSLNEDLVPVGELRRLEIPSRRSFVKATIAVDSLYTQANHERKEEFLRAIRMLAIDEKGEMALSKDEYGSNIGYQMDIALGGTSFGLTDAVGGPWDWRAGHAIITEAGGLMVDAMTGEKPTDTSTVVIYGSPALVNLALPHSQRIYKDYRGFNAKTK